MGDSTLQKEKRMYEQTVQANPAITDNTVAAQLKPKHDLALDAPRYLFSIGDFIVPQDKAQLRDVGGWAGGYRLGSAEHGGCPTAWIKNYMLIRGVFTPLAKRATPAFAGMEKNAEMRRSVAIAEGQIVANGGVYEVLPGEDIQTFTDDLYREMGFVEITALKGVEYSSGRAQALNRHFFPKLDEWLSGGEFPKLLTEWEALIHDGIARASQREVKETGNEMLRSCQNFRSYAEGVIERNRKLVDAAVNMAGYTFGWSGYAKLFAEQLGVELRAQPVNMQQFLAQNQGDDKLIHVVKAMMKNQREDRAAMMQIFGQYFTKDEIAAAAPQPEAPVPAPAPIADSATPEEADIKFAAGDKVIADGKEGEVARVEKFGRPVVRFADGEEKTFNKTSVAHA